MSLLQNGNPLDDKISVEQENEGSLPSVNAMIIEKPQKAAEGHVQRMILGPKRSIDAISNNIRIEQLHTRNGYVGSPNVVDHVHNIISKGSRYFNNGTTSKTVQPVPVYVLERLAKSSDKPYEKGQEEADSVKNLNGFVKLDTIHQGNNDPFIQTFKNDTNASKWRDFLGTVAIPSLKSEQGETTGSNTILDGYRLDDKWKGESRLVRCFQKSSTLSSADYDSFKESYDLESNDSDDDGSISHNKRRHVYMSAKERRQHYKERARYWIQENRKNWKPRLVESLLSNAYVPLAFRLITLALTVITLGLGGNLVKLGTYKGNSISPSPVMTVCVQSIAVFYILYTTYDEFTSQPLGLRNPTAKIRLILLDLLFIIFNSADLGLAYQELFDSSGICQSTSTEDLPITRGTICDRQRVLTAFLFLILVSWCVTFTIGVFRVVHVVTDARNRN